MTSDYSYAASETLAEGTKSSRKVIKSLKRLFIIVGILIFAELVWLFGISPFIPFSTVEVHGFEGFERSEILEFTGIGETSSYISTNAVEVKERLSGHLLVESAMVIKRFPDKLSIFLTPRRAAAAAISNNGSRQTLMYVDRQGVFFKYGEAGSHEQNIPILSGFENPRLNMTLPSTLVPLVESLCEISSASPELLATISEIRIERKAWEGFDLVLFPVHSSIKVRIENNLTEDVLRYMLLMLNVFETSYPKPDEIDFRSGMGAYRIKEQSL